jgi:hypothetical protein
MPNDALPDDLETLKAMLLAERCESERLRQIIKELQRHRFGRRAETLPEDQMLLGLEEVEQANIDQLLPWAYRQPGTAIANGSSPTTPMVGAITAKSVTTAARSHGRFQNFIAVAGANSERTPGCCSRCARRSSRIRTGGPDGVFQ